MSRNSYDFGATPTTTNNDTRNTFRPCIWQASNGPLFIRSWMDRQGYRHFILNTDWTDHHQANTSYQKLTTKTHRPKQLDPLGRSNLQHETRIKDTLEDSSIRDKNSTNFNQQTARNNKKLCKQLLSGQNKTSASLLKRQLIHRNQPGAPLKDILPEELSSSDKKSVLSSDKFSLDFAINPGENYQLTERVLQWLDLAGKAPSIPQDEHPGNKTNNRVYTANPSLGGGGAFSSSTSRKQPLSAIKRTESIHHLSLTLNEEDLLDHFGHRREPPNFHLSLLSGRKLRRQMSSSKIKPIVQPSTTTTTQISSTHKLNSPKSTTSSTSSSGATGPGPMTAGVTANQNKPPSKMSNKQKKSLGKLGKTESIENQYRSMIHRQLLETNCNTQLAKRQLHIFMPNMPSKGVVVGANPQSQSQNDCDSCLNSLISETSKP